MELERIFRSGVFFPRAVSEERCPVSIDSLLTVPVHDSRPVAVLVVCFQEISGSLLTIGRDLPQYQNGGSKISYFHEADNVLEFPHFL